MGLLGFGMIEIENYLGSWQFNWSDEYDDRHELSEQLIAFMYGWA
jgi:hypothetical protein